MKGKFSKLVKVAPKYWSGLTRETHLGYLGMLEPALVSNVMENLQTVMHGGNDFITYLNQFPKEAVASKRYKWLLKGANERNIPLVGAYMTFDGSAYSDEITSTSTYKPGAGLTKFYMVYAENIFSQVSAIVGEYPELYTLKVTAAPVKVGSNYVYEVQLMTGNLSLFVPVGHLAAGSRWSEDYGLVSHTLSDRGNKVVHVSPWEMENTMSTIRKEYKVPGEMIRMGKNQPLAFAFVDDKGETRTAWLDQLGWDFSTQFRREQAKLLLYGRSTMLDDGTFGMKDYNGYVIEAGYGMYEQIEGSNYFSYTDFNLDYLTDVAVGLTFGQVPGDRREMVLSTGEYGLYQFHRAAEDKASSITYLQDSSRIYHTGDGKMGIQGQFAEYKTVNGIKFKLMLDPLKDDNVRNKRLHPSGGLASSYNYDIIDFGTTNGESNIKQVYLEGDEEFFAYIPGMRDPFSPYNKRVDPRMAASSIDGYEVHKQFIGGMKVTNPLKAARIEYNGTTI